MLKKRGLFELRNGTLDLLKDDIYLHGLVLLMLIIITEATLRVDSKNIQLR